MNNTTTKEVLVVSAYLGGYPGPDRATEYLLFAKLYQEGYTYVQEGDEACLYVAKEPLPTEKEVSYSEWEECVPNLERLGWVVKDLEEARPDLLPSLNKSQQAYKGH